MAGDFMRRVEFLGIGEVEKQKKKELSKKTALAKYCHHPPLPTPVTPAHHLSAPHYSSQARLSSGAAVTNTVQFYRLAELHFASHAAYDSYIAWFQENVIPPPRTPAGKSAFKFYLISESETILRA